MTDEDTTSSIDATLKPLPAELDFQELNSAAASSAVPTDREIDISFFSHKSRKSTRLIGNLSADESIRARRDWLSFDLNENIYVTSIKVFATGYYEYNEMELSIIDALSGRNINESRKFGNDGFSFEPKKFTRGFGLNPDTTWLSSPYITKIEVRGIEERYFSDVISVLDNINREKSRIESDLNAHLERARRASTEFDSNQIRIAAQIGTLAEKEEEIGALEEQVTDLATKRDELSKRIEISSSVEKERNERVQAIEINIGNLNDRRKELSSEVAKSETQLRDLKNNINLFPTEIAGYVNQGTRNINLYFLLCAVPLAIISVVTYRLFSNAERLLNVNLATADILDYLISRIPYVVVSATILGISYSLVRGLVAEIININRRRQELYKVNIIATDVSYASQDGMDLDDEQRYDLLTQTKMEMLKEHLKMNLGDEFSYSPKGEYRRRAMSVIGRKTNKSESMSIDAEAEEGAAG